jgi:enoyl-CoA hydratase
VLLSAANIQRLATLVGQAMARDLLFTARTLNVAEARQVGLVQRQADDVLGAARDLAGQIARLAPLSVAGHKRALNLVAGELARESRGEIEALEAAAFQSADLQEGLAAFAEKRRPQFRGH